VVNDDLVYLSIGELQRLLRAGDLTSLELTRALIARIEALDRRGPAIRAIIEINPEAEAIAASLDRERQSGGTRGPLHGIPILLKDNIDTADAMETTAGSLALLDRKPARDATVAARLRAAGMVLLGKANMSEWANFRSTKSSSGWSARGGQALNPYVLDRSPCGSSSGSATAVAAGFAPASLGTETAGSILCPAAFNAVVGVKPTTGLTSRAGVIPIAHSQDTVGPFARSVADAATVLTTIAGPDERDPATSGAPAGIDYAGLIDSGNLRGLRIGLPRNRFFGYSAEADRIAEEAIAALRDLGAEIVDGAELPTADQIADDRPMFQVLLSEFKANLETYLQERGSAISTLAGLIAFNQEHAGDELVYFGQEIFEQAAETAGLDDPEYLRALQTSRQLGGQQGIDAAMSEHRLDALLAPSGGPPFSIDHANGDRFEGGFAAPAAMVGYPAISLPAGYIGTLPVGVTLVGRAYAEPMLLRIAHTLEAQLQVWRAPGFLAAETRETC
jgi:amidase